jgi:tetratricopeptide (TPR) repeat protein
MDMRLLAALITFLALTPAARAGSRTVARDAYLRGIKQYNLGEYQAALEAFTSAYNEVPDPPLLFNLAQCQRQLGARQKAITLYRSYLRESGGDPANSAEVHRLITSLEEAVAKENAASAAPPAGPIPPRPPEKKEAEPPPPPVLAAPVPTEAPPRRKPLLIAGAGVAAVGVVAVILGATFEGLAKQTSDSLTATDRAGGAYDPSSFARGRSYDNAGIAMLAVGGVLTAAGVIAVAVGARHKSPARAALQSLTVRF